MSDERWLVTGATGNLGSHLVRQLASDPRPKALAALGGRTSYIPPTVCGGVDFRPATIDLRKPDPWAAIPVGFRPTHVIHAAALTSVADAYARPDEARRVNSIATGELAERAAEWGARLVFVSTDMVFDGTAAPYRETDAPHPLSIYGATKAEAERQVAPFPSVLIARVPLMYGFPCTARETTFARQIAALRTGVPLPLFVDEFRTPAWVADVSRALIGLARSDLTGIVHVSGPERLSRYELLARCAALLDIKSPNLVPTSRLSTAAPEPRPADLALDGRRFAAAFPDLVPGALRADVFADTHGL